MSTGRLTPGGIFPMLDIGGVGYFYNSLLQCMLSEVGLLKFHTYMYVWIGEHAHIPSLCTSPPLSLSLSLCPSPLPSPPLPLSCVYISLPTSLSPEPSVHICQVAIFLGYCENRCVLKFRPKILAICPHVANSLPKVVLWSPSLLAHTALYCLQEMGDYCPCVIKFGMHVLSFSQAKSILHVCWGERKKGVRKRGGIEGGREGEGERERERARRCCTDLKSGYSNFNVVVSWLLTCWVASLPNSVLSSFHSDDATACRCT